MKIKKTDCMCFMFSVNENASIRIRFLYAKMLRNQYKTFVSYDVLIL